MWAQQEQRSPMRIVSGARSLKSPGNQDRGIGEGWGNFFSKAASKGLPSPFNEAGWICSNVTLHQTFGPQYHILLTESDKVIIWSESWDCNGNSKAPVHVLLAQVISTGESKKFKLNTFMHLGKQRSMKHKHLPSQLPTANLVAATLCATCMWSWNQVPDSGKVFTLWICLLWWISS